MKLLDLAAASVIGATWGWLAASMTAREHPAPIVAEEAPATAPHSEARCDAWESREWGTPPHADAWTQNVIQLAAYDRGGTSMWATLPPGGRVMLAREFDLLGEPHHDALWVMPDGSSWFMAGRWPAFQRWVRRALSRRGLPDRVPVAP